MEREEILSWLRESDTDRLDALWRRADDTRRSCVGDAVHLRGLVEFANRCARSCAYCGLRADHHELPRYRMTPEEILRCADQIVDSGCGTIVLQSGEDPSLPAEWLADVVGRIKSRTPLAVTLSVGERDERDWAMWRQAGADRYLLRFETSNRALFDRIHPPLPDRRSDRLADLRTLRRLNYEVGSGVMIGIPGQTYEDLANDIEIFAAMSLDMIGVGPFIAHPRTPLGRAGSAGDPPAGQVPPTEEMTYKVIALARLVCPRANIPSTTALATLNRQTGRELGLMRGANVVMPNLTPTRYRQWYEIYPNKACVTESPGDCVPCMRSRIQAIDRRVGVGHGNSRNRSARASQPIEFQEP